MALLTKVSLISCKILARCHLQGRSCHGHEDSLEECKPADLWNHDNYCRHDEDVAVQCGTGYDVDEGEGDNASYREVGPSGLGHERHFTLTVTFLNMRLFYQILIP